MGTNPPPRGTAAPRDPARNEAALLDDLTRQRLRNLGKQHDRVPPDVPAQATPPRTGTAEGAETVPARGPESGQAWRAYARAALEQKALSSALGLIHEVDDVRTRLATAFKLAGWFLLEDEPPQDVWAEESVTRELSELFADLAAREGGDAFDTEMNLFLPLVAAARAGVGLSRVLTLGASTGIVEDRLLLIIRQYLGEREEDGWARDDLLDLVETVATRPGAHLHRP